MSEDVCAVCNQPFWHHDAYFCNDDEDYDRE